MRGFTIPSAFARRWQYATGVAGVAVFAALVYAWPSSANRSPRLEAALVRHDSVGRMEVAHVRRELASAGAAKVRQAGFVERGALLRARVVAEPELAVALLPDVVALQDTAIQWANIRAGHLEVALDASELRAERLDSLVGMLRSARDDHCHLLRVVPCPSRGALIIAVSAGVAVVARR